MNGKLKKSRKKEEKRRLESGWMLYVCLSWGKIFRRAQLFCPKTFPFCRLATARKQLSIHSRQTAGEFQRHLTFHPRQTAGELQFSLFAFTVKRSKIPVPPLPAGKTPFALLELPGSLPLWVAPVSQAQILCENLCTSTEPVGPPACGPSAR